MSVQPGGDAGERLDSVSAIEKVDKNAGAVSELEAESEVIVDAGLEDSLDPGGCVGNTGGLGSALRDVNFSHSGEERNKMYSDGVLKEAVGELDSETAEVLGRSGGTVDGSLGGARATSLRPDDAPDTSLPKDTSILNSTAVPKDNSLPNDSLPRDTFVPLNNTSLANNAHDAITTEQPIIQLATSRLAFQPHSTYSPPGFSDGSNFCRDAQWCADGGSVLTVLEDASIVVLEVEGEEMLVKPRLSILQASPVLSTAWFPSASPTQPASYCFVAAVRDGPIKLLDASDGRLRASYKIVDHRERFIAPHSMAFNMYMNKLYCGFEDAIEVFDVHCPGAEGTRLHTVPTKKSRDGLRGLISALAFAPDWSGLYAAGSYSGAVALYTEDTGVQAQGWLGGVPGGVTQIRFNPAQPHVVHAAFRRTSAVASWDLRNPSEPARVYDRGVVETNQRLRFDVSPDGRWIVAGDERGIASVFDVLGESDQANSLFTAHGDAIGAVAFHPAKPYAMSVSGSRHFDDTASENSSSTEESSDTEDVDVMMSGAWRAAHGSLLKAGKRGPTALDSSLKLWSYEGI